MQDPKHQNDSSDDLSDAASSHAEVRTLDNEPLPSYNEASTSSSQGISPEKAPRSSVPQDSRAHVEDRTAQGPTVAEPFLFPPHELPSYSNVNAIHRPLAIPQVTASAAAPFLQAYPTALLGFGIPSESWNSFVETVSAFLSAKVSQQAVHHAADIASNIGDFHKQYALRTKEGFKNIGKSAKRFNPAGVIGGTIGLTMGSVGHVVGTVFQAAGSLTRKPQTPRERAAVYVATANKDWFNSRGLHAVLMNTSELAKLCEIDAREILSAVHSCGSASPEAQLAALRDVIGEVKVGEGPLPALSLQNSGESSRKAAGKRPMAQELHLGGNTLWLVLVQKAEEESTFGTAPIR